MFYQKDKCTDEQIYRISNQFCKLVDADKVLRRSFDRRTAAKGKRKPVRAAMMFGQETVALKSVSHLDIQQLVTQNFKIKRGNFQSN